MNVLLDECIDRRLASEFAGHTVRTVPQMGWAGMKNGELLAMAQVEFDVFLTVDRNLAFQHDVTAFAIAVMILRAPSNRLADLKHLVPKVCEKLSSVTNGSVIRIE